MSITVMINLKDPAMGTILPWALELKSCSHLQKVNKYRLIKYAINQRSNSSHVASDDTKSLYAPTSSVPWAMSFAA